jgi:NADH pyrophosphatase NudC (nudix superfamily)
MECPKCHKPLTPTTKGGRKLRCTNPTCPVVIVKVVKGEAVTIISGQSNSLSEGGDP